VGVRGKLRQLGQHGGVRYAASLPERVVRSASVLAAGTVRELAIVVLPVGLRRGRFYRNLVDVTLQFLVENVGGITSAESRRSSSPRATRATQASSSTTTTPTGRT
jgi:hypothetical protein